MRLALKLMMSLVALTLFVLGIGAFIDRGHRDELLMLDIEADLRAARAIRVLATAVADKAGPDAVRHMIEAGNAADLPRDARWIPPESLPPVPGRDLQRELIEQTSTRNPVWTVRTRPDGDERRYMYIPIAVDQKLVGVIEMSESLAPRVDFYRREQAQTATTGLVVLLLSATLAAVLGRRLVRRPLDAIKAELRTLGEGRYGAVRALPRRDEFGEISTEVVALGERLATRERLLHEDRLRTVGQLASGVAHELGTPLSVIGMRAKSIAAGEVSPDEAAGSAKVIAEQADRVSALVRQLLDYARRPGGTVTLVDAREVAQRAGQMLEPLARARHVTIERVGGTDAALVHVDPVQLGQVFTNLVLNAVQAMHDGGHVRVTTGRGRLTPPPGHTAAAGDHCWVEIADDGPGIAPEHLPHLFEPFFTTKGVGEGTGLGLAVAQTIVEDQGGWIAVESTPGKGARFRVVLPAAATATERLAS
jgi:signal transduction histidine kinase